MAFIQFISGTINPVLAFLVKCVMLLVFLKTHFNEAHEIHEQLLLVS